MSARFWQALSSLEPLLFNLEASPISHLVKEVLLDSKENKYTQGV